MPVTIYKMNVSPPARTVLVTAKILDIDIEIKEVSLPNKEHLTPEYLEKNPLHTIPLLEDGDFILADSHAIIIYLISKYRANEAADIYPNDVQQRAIVHQRLFFDASILFPRLLTIIKAIAFDNAPCVDEKKKSDVEEAYWFLEKYLEKSTFLAGDKMTIADISCATTVSSLNLVVAIDKKFVKVHQWLNRLKSENWYQEINQPGLNDLRGFLNACLQRNNK